MDKINYYLDRIENNLYKIRSIDAQLWTKLDDDLNNAYDYANNDDDFLKRLIFLNNKINKEMSEL